MPVPVNDIALQPFKQDNGFDNFLSTYAQSAQMKRQQDADARQKSAFDEDRRLQAIDRLGAALDGVQDGDAQGFERVKAFAVQNGLLDPTEAQKYTVEQLPQIRALSAQARQMAKERAAASMAQDKFNLDRRATEANIRQSDAQANAANALASQRGASGGGAAGSIDNTTFDNMSGLRREFTQATKDYRDVRDAFGRIQASAKNPSAAGDLSLIFNYMKVLDPGSTVREGEFATAQNATGIPERVVNAYNSAVSGQRLNPQQREDFVKRAGLLYNRQHQTYLATTANYEKLATRFGFDPSLVTFDQSGGIVGPQEQQAPAPQAPPSFTSGRGVFTDNPLQGAPQPRQPGAIPPPPPGARIIR